MSRLKHIRPRTLALGLVLLPLPLALGPVLVAQTATPTPDVFTLEEAINFALKNYPAVRAALAQVSGATAGVDLARTNYWPRADLLWQSNRATRNNLFGLLLPQSIIPAVSGPVLSSTSNDSVWGSAGGVLISWEPFDFGYRRATVNVARAAEARANAEVTLTRLDVAAAVADVFLTLLAAQERARAAQADVERRQVFARSVRVLAANQLRPGADASRADAELATARIQLIQAEQAERASRAALAQALGIAGRDVKIEGRSLLALPPQAPAPSNDIVAHPFAVVERAKIKEATTRVETLDRTYFPRFNLQSAIYGRGSGANVDGSVAGGPNGLGLERHNWALGLTVTFPLFDFASLHARRKIEASNERRQAARYDQALQDLSGQLERARAALDGARQVVENTPIELKAARDTESQVRARYQAGLGTIVEVAEAQRLLVQAEIDDALAKLNVWRGLFSVSASLGDLEAFLRLARGSVQGGP